MSLHIFTGVLVLAVAAPAAQREASQAETALVRIAADDTLDTVLRSLVEHTDDTVTYESSVAQRLGSTPCGLLSELSVPADRLRSVAEGLLALHGFEVSAVPSPPRVLVVHEAGEDRLAPLDIPETAAAGLVDRPALRVRVAAAFERLDPRILPVGLRPVLLAEGLAMRATEGGVVVEGRGTHVADLLAVLHALDSGDEAPAFGRTVASVLAEPSELLALVAGESLLDAVTRWATASELAPIVSEKARFHLREARVESAERVAAADVHAFLSERLHEHGLSTVVLGAEAPRLLAIQSADEAPLRRLPLDGTPDELARHPALQVVVARYLVNTDARRLPVTLRSVASDATPGAYMIALDRDHIAVGGPAGHVAALLAAALEADREGR